MRLAKPLRAISLFSGCGGLDLGLQHAGFESILSLDAEPLCAKSYAANFPGIEFLTQRIGDVNSRVFTSAVKKWGRIDLVAGGPPCPSFSKSRFYRKEMPRALDDPNGSETINGFINVVKLVRPRAFVLENVKGLSYGVHREALDIILRKTSRVGYSVSWKVLNAADYGVPQIRERCFVVGILDGTFSFPEPTHAENADDKPRWISAGQVLHDLDTRKNASDVGHFAGGKHHDLLREIPPGENYLFFTKERGHPNPKFKWRSRYWSFLLKLSPALPSWTIQARRSNNMGPLHWRNRILRIAEIKRLQSFPDDFELVGTLEQQWRQIGNAVPPLLAAAVGKEVARALTRAAKRGVAA